jgi:Tfp pilus assembly protein PilF
MDKNVRIAMVVPLIITVILVPLLAYSVIAEHGEQVREEMTIDSMYAKANVFVDKGDSDAALLAFVEIIEKDQSQEKAWHEVGKILNRFKMCDESLDHYEKYVKLFPDSVRGNQGYEIAKQC